MPYLAPEQVLREFSRYALAEIRPALADDEEFIRGQVGSLASTLRFLAAELEGFERAVETQRTSLLEALDEAAAAVSDETVEAAIADARDRVAGADGTPREIEATVLAAADEVLAAIDELPDDAARPAREPLYTFLDARVTAQLELLGRPADDG